MAREPNTPERLPPGTTLDHFEVSGRIGAGGMGEIYLARDTRLGRRVAIKLIRPERLRDPGAVTRFLTEARVTASFSHPHIVTIHHVGEHDGAPFLVLELLEGETLRARMDAGRPGPLEAARIALAIADALSEAHRHGVVHRDLKPSNIMVGRDGRLRVLDFGLARLLELPSPATVGGDAPFTDARAGSPRYMAPEVWRFQEPTSAVDLWALGVLLYELLSGHPPWEAPEVYALAAKVTGADPPPPLDCPNAPAGLVALTLRCLAREPTARPTAAEAKLTLERILLARPGAEDLAQSPFRGLRPFGERHAASFFGREEEIAQAVEWLREVPALAVVGPSGAGKSSFVASGIVPRLRERGGWHILAMRPGRRPFETLAARLVRGDTGSDSSEDGLEPAAASTARERERDLVRRLRETPGRLALELARLGNATRSRVLLFVDQLEEAHTHMEDAAERAAFLEAIGHAADDANGPVRVVVTLRDDFLGRVGEVAAMRAALAHVLVVRSPTPVQLASILRRSVAAVGYAFDDPALVDELVAAVGDEPAALSMLQLAGQALWERRDAAARTLRRASYDALGGLEGALAAQAAQALEGLSQGEVQLARHLLLRLVDADGARRIVPRGQLLEGLEPHADAVLERLVAARALRVSRHHASGDGGEVELVHESLVRSWSTLRRWLEEAREDLAFLAELCDAAALWRRRGRRTDEVWRGATLVAATARAERVERLPSDVVAFLAAGTRLQRRRRFRTRIILGVVTTTLACVALAFFIIGRRAEIAQANAEAAATRAIAFEADARAGEAEALRVAAEAALGGNDTTTARAMVRAALERSDSLGLRALWRRTRRAATWRAATVGSYVGSMVWAPEGDRVILPDVDALIELDAATGLPLAPRLAKRVDALDIRSSVSVRPDGRVLLISHPTSTNLETAGGELVWQSPFGTDVDGHLDACWAKGAVVVTGRDQVSLLELGTGALRQRFAGDEALLGAEFVDGCRQVLVGAWDGALWLWEPATGARAVVGRHAGGLSTLAASADGTRFATGGFDGRVLVWRVGDAEPEWVLPSTNERLRTVAFSPDGASVAAGGEGGDLELWDLASGRRKRVASDGPVFVVGFGPHGRRLAARSGASVTLWDLDLDEGFEAPTPSLGKSSVPVAFSPDGTLLASHDDGAVVSLWSVPDGRRVGFFSPRADNMIALAFAPTGRALATSGEDRAVRVYDVRSQRLTHDLRGHAGIVTGLAFSEDEQLLASVSADATVRVWDLADEGRSRVFSGHGQTVYAVAFDGPDHLLSAGKEGTLRRWRLADGAMEILARLPNTTWAWDRLPGGDLVGLDMSGTLSIYDAADLTRRTIAVPPEVAAARAAVFPAHIRALPGAPIVVVPSARHVELQHLGGQVEPLPTPPPGQFVDVDAAGRYVAFQTAAGTQLWDLTTRASRWWSRAVLVAPRAAWTHRGWVSPTPELDVVSVPRTRWVAAIEAGAERTRVDPTGRWGCLARGGTVERWDLDADEGAAVGAAASGELAAAIAGGCVVSTSDAVTLLRPRGPERLVDGPGTALADLQGLVVVTPSRARLFDVTGAPAGDAPVSPDVTVAARLRDRLATATDDGRIAVGGLVMRGTPDRAGTALADGPGGTLVVGFAGGTVGVWDPATGGWLDGLELNGDVEQLRVDAEGVVAASELGDAGALDLSILVANRCDVLREVWKGSPAAWADGAARISPAPRDHACPPESAARSPVAED